MKIDWFSLVITLSFKCVIHAFKQIKRSIYTVKLKFHLQIGVTQQKNVATPLSTSGINATRQRFQMKYITLF